MRVILDAVLPVPPSVNAYLKRRRNGGSYKSQKALNFESTVTALCYEAGVYQPTDKPIGITFKLYPKNVRSDLDNVFKVLLDSFEHLVYENDNQVVKISAEKFPVDKQNPRVEISIAIID